MNHITHPPPCHPHHYHQSKQNAHLHGWTHMQPLVISLKVLLFSSCLKGCYCYLSVAVIKPLDQGHLQKKQFIWAKVLEGPSQHGGRKPRDHICKHKRKQNSGRRKQLVGWNFSSWSLCPGSDIFPPARLCYLNLPKEHHPLGTKCSSHHRDLAQMGFSEPLKH